ncbi:cilia- and flagella-associated protein 99 isoform X2 [Corapipo altera]|nr:cilia- and flagella-associated protein 99 isoform X2 [Corapipo altera]XP_027518467.1 cilia- and flagella-associated protein 99 isoform X2 [Corapipo altera]XP_027518468.1 cilia- and flagella-associated protein 99 isoform X2 [Corapipo altera]XP_027518469.1 cilia- and flagella-associated protein 99 isoform X2 [Corapipo altera]
MMKMVRHRELIAVIVQQLDKFNPENQNVEDFLNESAVMLQTLKMTEEKFVLDTLAGCIEYKSLLDVVVNAFYAEDGRYCLIPERNLYIVICYLATFQLEELGLQHFSRIVKSLDTAKMQKFLRFFFNKLHLNTWIKDEWSHFYDSLYVKENLIDPLLRWQPKVQQLIEQLTNKLNNCATTAKTSKVTQPKEFNLTVPKPRAIPLPLPTHLPVLEKRRPVPPSTYKPPKEIKQLEEIKEKNFQKASDLLLKANTDRFRCATMKPEKRESTHDSMKSKPSFRAQKIQSKIDNIPIKLNTAAILREGALYQRKMEDELKRIENLEQGFGDPSEFLEWQKQMRGKDLEEQLAEIECRRLQGKLSHEEAVLARQNVIQENKKKADLLREEKAELMHQHAEKRLQEQKEMKELAEQVMEGHKNVKQVKTKLQEYKQQIAQQVSEESGELLRQALKEEEEKAKKRYELIQQIRALESIPGIRHKFVDLTETGGHGLFCEMSIVELRERLALLKEAQKAAEEEKRDQIIHEKQAKEQLILEKLDQISQFRAELGRAAALKQEEKKRKSQSGERPTKDERILNLQRKIVEKKMERKKQAGLLKIIPQKTSIMPSKDSSQGNHWRELEEIRERQFKLLQHGFMAREAAQKRAACVAARIGTTTYILRSDIQ